MYNIAIVDDEKDILEVLKKFLSRNNNFSISTYDHALSALPTVKNGNYDLVLLDIMMPTMNGLDFLEKLKENDSEIKVIMMTAFDSLDKMIKSHKLDAKDYITKPFDSLRDIETKILEILEK